ncbi:MAG: hypothetical protein AAFX99_28285, partial [Myxococcota bacterium]
QENEITPCLGIVCTADEVCVDNVCVPADPGSNPEPNSGTGTTSEGTAEPATTSDEGQDSSGVDTEEDAGCHMTPGAPASSSGTLFWLVMVGLRWLRRGT